MHSPMRILRHSLGMAICCAMFLAGKLVAERGRRWDRNLARRPDSYIAVSKIFFFSGKFVEVVAFVAGFIEAVAVMVLASAWLYDLVAGLGLGE